ncbi:MAG: dihydrolipoamide acetyltransferase family protein [Acidimicrobiales bacterium]
MTTYGVRLPDVGEGVAEAELVSWLVAVGDHVTHDSMLAEVMTDKATVEVASPVTGVVVELRGEPGDILAVGSELVMVELAGEAPQPRSPAHAPGPTRVAVSTAPAVTPPATPAVTTTAATTATQSATPSARSHALAAPAVRARAERLGIDLASVSGSGPDGRVLHDDLDRLLTFVGTPVATTTTPVVARTEPLRGVRRVIAQRLTAAWSEIPHITYVDGVDATELEVLRAELNRDDAATRLTMLPFVARAVVLACLEQPDVNAHLTGDPLQLEVHDTVHLGIATQTPDGLTVPVVRHAERLDLRALAGEIARVSGAAREGRARRDELSGSTITITSLGALGGLVTTPLINQPEVAIIGVNKLETRPVWRDGAFQPRQVFNLSSSFDHRVVDGWDAATFVQRVRRRLEVPALLFT